MFLFVFMLLTLALPLASAQAFHCDGHDSIEKVDFTKVCGGNKTVTSAVAVISPEHNYKLLPNCLKCEFLLIAEPGYQLGATFYTFGTDAGKHGKCDKNRLDVYNGDGLNATQLLSNKTGLCGCNLPCVVYKSGENYLTLTFNTICDNTTIQHGEFGIVISAIKKDEIANISSCPGQFECSDRKCLDKNLICNGKAECPDKSDEVNCKKTPVRYLTPIWLYALVGVSGVCLIVLVIILVLLCCRYCCWNQWAKAYERFQ